MISSHQNRTLKTMKRLFEYMLPVACPQHYICWSELPVPRIAVTFSLQEVEVIERDCAVYRGRMERIAKHSAISREEQVLTLRLIVLVHLTVIDFYTISKVCYSVISDKRFGRYSIRIYYHELP